MFKLYPLVLGDVKVVFVKGVLGAGVAVVAL